MRRTAAVAALALVTVGCEQTTEISETVNFEITITRAAPQGAITVSDMVTFDVAVTRNGEAVSTAGRLTFSSDDADVLRFGNASQGTATARDTGSAMITVEYAEPTTGDTLKANTSQSVNPFTQQIQAAVANPDSLTVGDTVTFTAVQRDANGDSVGVVQGSFASTVASVLDFFADDSAFVSDLGQAKIAFTPADTMLRIVPDTLDVEATGDAFYAQPSAFSGDFGEAVSIGVSDEPHAFTDSSAVVFPNGIVAWIDSITAPDMSGDRFDSLYFRVPGGATANGEPLTLTNLADDRGDLETTWTFSANVGPDDPYEPNDDFPLETSHEITLPLDTLLIIDPNKSPDDDLLYFELPLNPPLIDVIARWQGMADVDFRVCEGESPPPPSDYDPPPPNEACAHDDDDNTTDPSEERAEGLNPGPGVHILRVRCASCPAEPLTYRLIVREN